MSESPQGDLDPNETREWLESIDSVLKAHGPERAHFLLERLIDYTRRSGAYLPFKPKKKGGVLGIGGQRQNRPVWSGPLLANDKLLIVGQTGELVALNAKSGVVEKRMELKGASTLSPIAMGDTVYVVTEEADLIAIR